MSEVKVGEVRVFCPVSVQKNGLFQSIYSPVGQHAWEVSARGRQLHQDCHYQHRQLLPMLHS